MRYTITPYVLISAAAAVVAILVAVIAWRRRDAPGGKSLAGLMIAVSIWSAGAAMEYATVGIPGKVMWAKVQYVGVVSTPVFFLLLALEYNHLDRWLTRRKIALLFIVPLITLVMAFTNDWHGLMWPTIVPTGAPEANLADYTHGIAFWVGSVGYGYLLMFVGTILLIRAALRFPAPYRNQAVMLIAASLAPWLVNIVYILEMSPVPGLEMTPLVLVVTGSVFAWTIFRLHLLDLVPVARETLVETMVDGMVVLDAQDRVVDMNPAAQKIIAAPGRILPGTPAGRVFASWPEWGQRCSQLRAGRVELASHDVTARTFEITVSPLHDRQGRYSGRLLVLHDITARKAAQMQIEALNDELEARVAARTQDLLASQARFQQVISSITDHVFAVQIAADGTITPLYSSPRRFDLTGYPPEALSDDFLANLGMIVHPEDREAAFAHFYGCLESDGGEIENRWVRADGSIVWIRSRLRVQQQGCDKIMFGVSSDVTERRRMEQIDVEMRALAELDRLRTELISNVSHELRTPLGLIKAASTTLQRTDVAFPPATQQRILQGITDEADRLEHLVADLLDISRFDRQRFTLNLERVDLTALVVSMVDAAERKLAGEPAPAHRFVRHLPTRPVTAIVDSARIEQVVRNLIENAIRYSPEGGAITVALQASDLECQVRVTDSGIGIAPEEQGRIFERFYRSRDPRVRHVHGTGLGLAICREILQAHHGTLSVASTPGAGSTFTVHLPCSSAQFADDGAGDTPDGVEES